MKAEGPYGSSANSPQGGKVKESVCDDSFIPLPMLQRVPQSTFRVGNCFADFFARRSFSLVQLMARTAKIEMLMVTTWHCRTTLMNYMKYNYKVKINAFHGGRALNTIDFD